jgi:hypothetical protein
MIEGRAPMPPVAQLLGWTLLSIDPGRGEIRVRFEPSQISSTRRARCRAEFSPPCSTILWAPLPSLSSAAIDSRRLGIDDAYEAALVLLPPSAWQRGATRTRLR